MPVILSANEEAVSIWHEVCGLLKYGAMGPVSLDVPAVKIFLDLHGVDNKLVILRKLITISSIVIDRINKSRED